MRLLPCLHAAAASGGSGNACRFPLRPRGPGAPGRDTLRPSRPCRQAAGVRALPARRPSAPGAVRPGITGPGFRPGARATGAGWRDPAGSALPSRHDIARGRAWSSASVRRRLRLRHLRCRHARAGPGRPCLKRPARAVPAARTGTSPSLRGQKPGATLSRRAVQPQARGIRRKQIRAGSHYRAERHGQQAQLHRPEAPDGRSPRIDPKDNAAGRPDSRRPASGGPARPATAQAFASRILSAAALSKATPFDSKSWSSSPDSVISVTMSQPPTNSPLT